MGDVSAYIKGKPRLQTPPKACDCHSHIFGPADRYPFAPGGNRIPHGDAPVAQYKEVLGGLGIERAVIVQASAYGTDNRRVIDAIREFGPGARGIATCAPSVTPHELSALNDAGVRGLRVSATAQDIGLKDLPGMAPRIADIGWHVQFQGQGANALEWLPRLQELPVPVVIDHIARMPGDMGLDDPRFVALLRLLEKGDVWLKISGPYYTSVQGAPYADMVPRIRALAEHRPDRLVWALNWPHPGFAMDGKPEAAACLDVLLDAVPDTRTRNAILADNPGRLYGFPN